MRGPERSRRGLCEAKIKGYRINPDIYSKPDFSFGKYKIAIFCDGDFWHGRDYNRLKDKLTKTFWRTKIEKNMERDIRYNKELKNRGWIVLRFWGSEINKDVNKCVNKVKKALNKRGYGTQEIH